MNYNRRRNIFTLGDFHHYPNPTQQIKAQINRRQNSDPFERDPFKIQSYNFRYAERPSYPLPNLGNNSHHHHYHHHRSGGGSGSAASTTSSTVSNKRFETFFYNYDFTPSVHDKENPPTNKFREFRRRKFLLDNQQQNPAAAGMFGQAATSRQSSTLQQQNMYHNPHQQQLHPIYERIGGGGRSASQTAIAAAAASAAAAAAGNMYNGCGRAGLSPRLRGGDDSGRHHQTFGSATDTSSIATAAAAVANAGQQQHQQRYGRDTSPRISSNQKCARPSSARSTGNREYLRALATAHIGATASQSNSNTNSNANYLGRGRSSSRSSLERGRRMRTEPMGGGSGSRQNANTYGQAPYNHARGAGLRELSGTRASPTKYATSTRQPLQAIHTASPNRVTATVEKTEGTCSGCQININIKGLDTSQLGDNVTIKIESDKNSTSAKTSTSKTEQFPAAISALNNIYNGIGNNAQQQNRSNDIAYAKLVEIKRNSEVNRNLDIKPKLSAHQLLPPPSGAPTSALLNSNSATFMIDKRLSKFAMANAVNNERERKHIPRSSSHSRIPMTSSTTRAMGLTSSTTALRNSNSTENIKRIGRNASHERMPSMVPWCLDTTVRQGFGATNDDGKSLRAQSSNLIKHTRPSYDATLNDVRKMRRQAVLAAYKPLSLQRPTSSMSPSMQSRKVENNNEKVGNTRQRTGNDNNNTKSMTDKKTAAAAANFLNTNILQRRQSHHSLRSLKASKSTINSQSNSHLELGNSPTIIMRRSRSCIRPEEVAAGGRHASDSQSHLSVKTTPLNVNINVFADKLKLLRV